MAANYISREAAIKIVSTYLSHCMGHEAKYILGAIIAEMSDNDILQAADVRPVVMGRWKETVERIIVDTPCACCSACGESIVLGEFSFSEFSEMMRFCPQCGADMRGGAEDG